MPSMSHAELMTAYREEAGASPWLTFIKAALTIRDHGVGSKAGAVYDAYSLMGSCVVVLNGAPTAFFGGVNRDPAAPTYPDDTRDRAAISDAMEVLAAKLSAPDLSAVVNAALAVADSEGGDLLDRVADLRGALDAAGYGDAIKGGEKTVSVLDIRPGDQVDLAPVPGCDGEGFEAVEFEYARVIHAERERPDCVRLDFENFPSIGFKIGARLIAVQHDDAAALHYAVNDDPTSARRYSDGEG